MIDLVTKLFNLLTLFLQSAFLVTSFIGRVIVGFTTALLSTLITIFKSVLYFFQIIYEDNILVLIDELPNVVYNLLADFIDWCFCVNYYVGSVSEYFCYRIINIITTIAWVVNAVSTIVIEVLFLIKKFVILFGNSLWIIVTFIPVHLPVLVISGFAFVKDFVVSLIVDGYMVLLKFTNFLTDVPIESFIGIISAFIILRICIHFREYIEIKATSLYWSLVRKLLYLYHTIYNYCTDSDVRVIARMAQDHGVDNQIYTDSTSTVDDQDDPSEALCVVCQERQKCVLILPCRHVCLCRDCCIRLYGYQRTCPICRTFIYHSVNIYL